MSAANETTAQSTEIPVGTLKPQLHGGALRHGGPNRGGPGRPGSKVQKISERSYVKRMPILAEIADSEEEKASDRIAAIRELGRYAVPPEKGGTKIEAHGRVNITVVDV
jgi:hypothetical protein